MTDVGPTKEEDDTESRVVGSYFFKRNLVGETKGDGRLQK